MHDHNPHFKGGMPLIFIKMDTINEWGAICYCEEANLIRQYVNIKYLHKQDTFTFTHMFVLFMSFPLLTSSEDLMTHCNRNIPIYMARLAGTVN